LIRLLRALPVIVAISGLTPPPVTGQQPPVASVGFVLQDEVQRLVQGTGWRNSDWSVLAVSLERGDTLTAIGADLPLAPASNQKLFTTAAALHHLGPDYRFPTYLLTDGEVLAGVLTGNLVIYGTGDPAISDRLLDTATDPLRNFARTLAELGVHTIEGDIVGDGSHFEGPMRRPAWNPNDLDSWYAARVSALTFNENVVTVRIRPTSPGAPAELLTLPSGAGLPVVNTSRTVSGARSTIMIVRDDPDGPIELRGELGTGAIDVWRRLTVSDPELYAASVLRRVLEEEGIRVTGSARSLGEGETSPVRGGARTLAPAFASAGPPPLRTIDVHYSPRVEELLHVVNRNSHNLYAELLLFTVGRVTTGVGSFEAGSRAMTDYLVRTVGIRAEDLHVDDGSGLSRLNRATASSFVELLAHVAATEHADVFWSTLPEAGSRAELGRMYSSLAAGNLRAKTGTINRVSALSGVVRGVGGEPILFSIISNNVPSTSSAKRVEDRIGIRLASFGRSWVQAGEGEFARVEFGDYGPRLTLLEE